MEKFPQSSDSILSDRAFSRGWRGQRVKRYQASFERPSIWHVFVTLYVMFMLYNFTITVLKAMPAPSLSITAVIISMGYVTLWFFLIRDLVRQVLLLFPRQAK